jgi:hypothetical protein
MKHKNIPGLTGTRFLWLCMTATDGLAEFNTVPRSFVMQIDDMGWQGGPSLDGIDGPYRVGTDRDPELADYQEIVEACRNAGTRVCGLFVLSELDRSNICAKPEYNLPIGTSDMTEFGTDWDNSQYAGTIHNM